MTIRDPMIYGPQMDWSPPAKYDGDRGPAHLTVRELFAAMAMQGIVSNPTTRSAGFDTIAQLALMCADALLKEIAK